MNKEQLNELNIFGLREIARRTGVSSPTTKKKEELIDGILAIRSGKMKPHVRKTKQGRPPKEFALKDFVDDFLNDEIKPSRVLTLKQETTKYGLGDIETVGGYVELFANNSALLSVIENCEYASFFISQNLVEEYGLRAGDKVVAELGNENGKVFVKSIYNINNCPIIKFSKQRKNYHELEHEVSSKKLPFSNAGYDKFNIKFGESVYFYGIDNNQNTISVANMLNDCKVENKIYINVSLADKNKHCLNLLNNVEKFVANLTDNIADAQKVVSIACERAKRIMENGENVVVVIDDLLSIQGVDNSNYSLMKNLITLTKNSRKSGSITLFSIMPNNGLVLAEKLADKRIQVSEINN